MVGYYKTREFLCGWDYVTTMSFKQNSDKMAARIDELSRQQSCWAEKGKREYCVVGLEGIEAKIDSIECCYWVW